MRLSLGRTLRLCAPWMLVGVFTGLAFVQILMITWIGQSLGWRAQVFWVICAAVWMTRSEVEHHRTRERESKIRAQRAAIDELSEHLVAQGYRRPA